MFKQLVALLVAVTFAEAIELKLDSQLDSQLETQDDRYCVKWHPCPLPRMCGCHIHMTT